MTEIAPKAPQREIRVIQDAVPVFDTGRFEHMQRIASVMAQCEYVPEALRQGGTKQAAANCFMIVNQAVRWQMDPFALAQHAYELKGKLGYEGKVIAAAINSDARLDGRLRYEFSGDVGTPQRTVKVIGRFADTGQTEELEGSVEQWRTKDKGGNWKSIWQGQCDQQLTYRGVREWARRYMPEKILGVYSGDELEDISNRRSQMKDITPPAIPDIPDVPEIPDIPEDEPPEPIVDVDAFLDIFEAAVIASDTLKALQEVWDADADRIESDPELLERAQAMFDARHEELAQEREALEAAE